VLWFLPGRAESHPGAKSAPVVVPSHGSSPGGRCEFALKRDRAQRVHLGTTSSRAQAIRRSYADGWNRWFFVGQTERSGCPCRQRPKVQVSGHHVFVHVARRWHLSTFDVKPGKAAVCFILGHSKVVSADLD
jgi:hypothetical protein